MHVHEIAYQTKLEGEKEMLQSWPLAVHLVTWQLPIYGKLHTRKKDSPRLAASILRKVKGPELEDDEEKAGRPG